MSAARRSAASAVRSEVLPGGTGVLLRESRGAPVVEVQLWARSGSADEAAGEHGLAHFLEHMLFKGTATRGVGEIAGAIEGAGGSINAYTSFDVTCYHATLPSDALELGIEVLCDAVLNPAFDPGELKREIEVVLEEIGRSDDNPHHVLSDALFAESYRVHPYGRPILGTRESVAAITPEAVRGFHRRHYAPGNLVAALAGDFDGPRALALLAAAFEGASPGPRLPRKRPVEPEQPRLRSRLLARPFERASLECSWPAVPLRHPDSPLLDMLAFILGGGESARLLRRVKEELGLADRVDASCYTPLDAGVFGVALDCQAESAAPALEAVLRETERLRREPVSEEELDRARRNFLATRAWERESVSGMAHKMGNSLLLAGDADYEDAWLARVRAATQQDLLRVAQEWLPPARITLAAVLPESQANALDSAGVAAAVQRGCEATARLFAAPRALPAARPARAAGSAEPRGAAAAADAAEAAARCAEAGIHGYTLANGVRIFVQPRRSNPVVAARAALIGGQLAEDEESAGLSQFLAGMWLRGTASRSAADFAARVESLAADVDGFSGRNSSGLSLDCTVEQFPSTLDLFAEALLAPAFAQEEIERERRDTLAAIARRQDRLSARAMDLFARTHFARHPYRLPLAGSAETVSRFDRAQIAAHHQRLVRGGNLVIAVAGDVEPAAAAAAVARRFGALPEGPPPPLPPAEPAPAAPRRAAEKLSRAQVHLVTGFRGLALDDADRPALEVLVQLLGGHSGRLFMELRERQGLAYTVSAFEIAGLAPGWFAIYMGTAPEKAEQALTGMRDALHRVCDSPPPAEEFERARRCLIGNHAISRQRSSTRAMHMALDASYGLGAAADEFHPEQLRAVRPEDVLRTARRIINFQTETTAEIRA
ncbi:MAG: pitrilysin family protein [Deltaproteobacteria bacterium]|nr:pitrilysin family protein [Deltaproteobacteria bacterium]